jgi:hypothetical protein
VILFHASRAAMAGWSAQFSGFVSAITPKPHFGREGYCDKSQQEL